MDDWFVSDLAKHEVGGAEDDLALQDVHHVRALGEGYAFGRGVVEDAGIEAFPGVIDGPVGAEIHLPVLVGQHVSAWVSDAQGKGGVANGRDAVFEDREAYPEHFRAGGPVGVALPARRKDANARGIQVGDLQGASRLKYFFHVFLTLDGHLPQPFR